MVNYHDFLCTAIGYVTSSVKNIILTNGLKNKSFINHYLN